MTAYDLVKNLGEKLWDSTDPDCQFAEELGFKDDIIELFAEAYDSYSFIDWLESHNLCIADGFRYCDYEYIDEIATPEDLDYELSNCLMHNDRVIIRSW